MFREGHAAKINSLLGLLIHPTFISGSHIPMQVIGVEDERRKGTPSPTWLLRSRLIEASILPHEVCWSKKTNTKTKTKNNLENYKGHFHYHSSEMTSIILTQISLAKTDHIALTPCKGIGKYSFP